MDKNLLHLRSTGSLKSAPGDFAVRVTGDDLWLPKEVAKIAEELGANNGAEFLAFAESSPSLTRLRLGWNLEAVDQANRRLRQTLRPFLPDPCSSPCRRSFLEWEHSIPEPPTAELPHSDKKPGIRKGGEEVSPPCC